MHIDANNFYASVECALNPDYKGKPLAVSGNPKIRTGIILAKNYIAKEFKVQTGEPIWKAKEKCPDLICVGPNMPLYEEYSAQLHEIYSKYTHLIEPFGIDECWIDVTDTQHLFGGAENIANEIRERVKSELGITVSVGISFCKLFAKLGSDLKKPDAVTVITRKNYEKIIYPLPIEEIIGIGHRMKTHLNRMNILTLGDLVDVPGYILKQKFGKTIYELRRKLLGFDKTPVASSYEQSIPKSVGNGTTTVVDIYSRSEIENTILFLAEKVSTRLRSKNLYAQRVSVSLRNNQLQTVHHSCVVNRPINTANDILTEIMKLIDGFWKYNQKIRSVRIATSLLVSGNMLQVSIFDVAEKDKQKLNKTLDALRNKYGKDIIKPASLMQSDYLRKE